MIQNVFGVLAIALVLLVAIIFFLPVAQFFDLATVCGQPCLPRPNNTSLTPWIVPTMANGESFARYGWPMSLPLP